MPGAPVPPLPRPLAALLIAAAAPAVGVAADGPPNALLTDPPAIVGPGPAPPGSPGWTHLGRVPPEAVSGPRGRTLLRLAGNTTLVSPAFQVPEDGQALLVTARGRALLAVRARPTDGGPEVALATLQLTRRLRSHDVALAGLGGRVVRLVLDPVPGLGQAVEIGVVGGVSSRLSAWTLLSGAPRVPRVGGRRALRVHREAIVAVSASFDAGPGARALSVAIRGDGDLVARAGGRAVRARGDAVWRRVRVPLPEGAGVARLRLRATPGDRPLLLRDLGLVVRATVLRRVRVRRSGQRAIVTGRAGPFGRGLRIELVVGGRVVDAARAAAGGRFRLVGRARGRGRVLAPGSDLRLPASHRVRLAPDLARVGAGELAAE